MKLADFVISLMIERFGTNLLNSSSKRPAVDIKPDLSDDLIVKYLFLLFSSGA